MYAEQERLIFGPFDRGDGHQVYADPIRVRRRLTRLLDGDPRRALAACRGPDPGLALEAEERVFAAAIQAFDLVPFDPATGQGLREDGIVAVLNAFLSWEEAQRDFFGTSPTCAAASEAPSAAV